MPLSDLDAIHLFQSYFFGREDVFAIRWEKAGKSGYMPAYHYDPYHYAKHKISGGTFQNYPHKTYLPLNSAEIEKHIKGIQQIGVYPLLIDNTSRFLVADFDEQNWKKEAVAFVNACEQKGIPAYLERSRSGNGGHVWIFFESPYPAIRSRKIFNGETDLLSALRNKEEVLPLIIESIMSKKKELGGQMITDFEHIDPNTIKNRSMITIGG